MSKQFSYRGFMIDAARHYQTIEELKAIIDAMALLGFNQFHWHLSDDQGWRFECNAFPLLNTVAAVRPYSDFGKTVDNTPYGRVYTKAEMAEIVRYCAAKGINVIPEIDMPGHTSALLSAYPSLACGSPKTVPIKTHQGIFKDVLCPANDAVYETIYTILDEVCALFPSEYIHIGGDETPSDHWRKCPACQALMAREDLTDYHEYQNLFMNRIIDYLERKGRHAMVWNDAAKGKNLDRRAVLQYWKENDKASIDFINRGGHAILSPFSYYYLDYDYDITPLNRVYAFDPMLKGLSENGKSHILGVEAPIWTEYIDNAETMQRLLFPRAIAVAYTANGKGDMPYWEFLSECTKEITQLRALGITLEDTAQWTKSRTAMPQGWLRFVRKHYSVDYIKSLME